MEKHKRQSGREETTGVIPEFGTMVGRCLHWPEGYTDKIRLRNTQLPKIEVIPVKWGWHEKKKNPILTVSVYVGWRACVVRHLDWNHSACGHQRCQCPPCVLGAPECSLIRRGWFLSFCGFGCPCWERTSWSRGLRRLVCRGQQRWFQSLGCHWLTCIQASDFISPASSFLFGGWYYIGWYWILPQRTGEDYVR